MRNLAANFLFAVLAFVIAGCGPTTPVKPDEPVIVRPVVVVERVDDELLIAISHVKDGNFRQAEANLEEIIKVRPDIAEAHFNLGLAKFRLTKYAEALASLRIGLKLQPADMRAHRLVAVCQREMGLFSEAESTYLAALALAPDDDRLHFNLGILYDLYLRNPTLALEHYRRYQSLQKTPDAKVAGWIVLLERGAVKK